MALVAAALLGIAVGTFLAYHSPLYGACLREVAAWIWAARRWLLPH
jgi:hypothetical protein